MNLRPVIERELICEARNEVNYWLRLIGASALLFIGALYLAEASTINQRWHGWLLFARMNRAIMATALIVVPIFTADVIAREKREGTLGLLFLTPLKAPDIVMGKCLVHALRSLTILIAAVPLLCVPLMMGGISFWQVLSAVATDLAAVCIGMAAGIHASVRQIDWLRAVGHALGISFVLSLGFWTCAGALSLAPSIGGFLLLPASLLILRGFLRSGSIWLAGNWRRELYRPTEPYWVSQLAASPFWRRVLSWPSTTAIDRNPVAWLSEHTWTGRATKWIWFAIVLGAVLLGGCLVGPIMDYTTWLGGLTLGLSGGIAFLSSNALRREQETGALELLLVTPLTPKEIVRGRLHGIIMQFLPATLLLGFFWAVPAWFSAELPPGTWLNCGLGLSTLATVPLIGFRFALLRIHYVSAWLLTLLTGYVVPMTAVFLLRVVFGSPGTVASLMVLLVFSGWQVMLAAFCFRRVLRILDRKSFRSAPP